MFLPPAFPIFLFFSFCVHIPQLSLVSVVYIPDGLSCKNASELHVSAVCLWWLRWPQSDGVLGAGPMVSMGTWLPHGPEGATKCLTSYFLA